MLAHGVQLLDGGPGAEQQGRGPGLVLEGQAGARGGQQGRGPAGEQHEQHVVAAEASHERFGLVGGPQSARIGHGMAREQEPGGQGSDRIVRHFLPRIRHHEALGQRGAQALLGGPRHGEGRLAHGEQDQPASKRPLAYAGDHETAALQAQMGTDEATGLRGGEARLQDSGGGRAQGRPAPASRRPALQWRWRRSSSLRWVRASKLRRRVSATAGK